MRIIGLFLLPVFTLLAACASKPATIKIHNSKEDFVVLINKTDLKSSDSFSKSWGDFERKYSDIYADLFSTKDPSVGRKKLKRLERFRVDLPYNKSRILNFYDSANETINLEFKRFSKTFPDVQSGISVFVIPSLGTFNGRVVDLPSRGPSLLLGLDLIVERNEDLNVLFSHEFFHLYQNNKMVGKKYWQTLATAIWSEGFATYISGRLNPNNSDAILLMDETLAKKCADNAFVAERAADFLKVIDKTQAEDPSQKLYTDWFSTGTMLPSRSGYCLGFMVLRELAKSHSYLDMVNWDEDEFAPRIKETLKKLADNEPLQ